ncbi:hypothetical protein Tcan_17728 [Toxocara canis]|uniref:Uncharacterized protein n=1 Tax=Toxocara canis TaxID=6265 RepID=A0A0B2VYS6_TOXCA|nr:hypothetical protein Tcan_17728 [Toxocara canis]
MQHTGGLSSASALLIRQSQSIVADRRRLRTSTDFGRYTHAAHQITSWCSCSRRILHLEVQIFARHSCNSRDVDGIGAYYSRELSPQTDEESGPSAFLAARPLCFVAFSFMH